MILGIDFNTTIEILEKQRNSSIELLRIVSMLLILMFHYATREYGLYVTTNDLFVQADLQSKLMLSSIGRLGVPIFVFISGYYGVKYRTDQLLNLIIQGFFYMLVSCVGLYCIENNLHWKQLYNFLNEWWFLHAYIVLYILSPGIEWMFCNLSRKRMCYITILMYSMAYSSSYPGNYGGSGLLDMLSMYLLARCLALYLNDSVKSRAVYWMFALLSLRVVLVLIALQTHHLGVIILIVAYSNPLNIFIAASVFYVFNKLQFSSLVLNWLATGTLAVYLLSESDFGKVVFLPFFDVKNFSVIRFILASSFIYVIIALVDKIRMSITDIFIKKIL